MSLWHFDYGHTIYDSSIPVLTTWKRGKPWLSAIVQHWMFEHACKQAAWSLSSIIIVCVVITFYYLYSQTCFCEFHIEGVWFLIQYTVTRYFFRNHLQNCWLYPPRCFFDSKNVAQPTTTKRHFNKNLSEPNIKQYVVWKRRMFITFCWLPDCTVFCYVIIRNQSLDWPIRLIQTPLPLPSVEIFYNSLSCI